jgi:hypothetical protein
MTRCDDCDFAVPPIVGIIILEPSLPGHRTCGEFLRTIQLVHVLALVRQSFRLDHGRGPRGAVPMGILRGSRWA